MSKYPLNIDCVWLAVDQKGQVGAFVTGGSGPIPTLTLDNSVLLIEDVESEIAALPPKSEFILLVEMKRPDDFIAMAQRGLYTYDWRDVHRTSREATNAYEPIAIPLNPIHVDALPDNLKVLAASASLSSDMFCNNRPLDVCSVFECSVPD